MLSCKNLFAISKRLSTIQNCHDMPFGGINVVLCGDFAQLTPVKGVPLYSGDLFSDKSSMTTSDQENAIGKSIWQQFTNVVLLKQSGKYL